MSYPHNPLEGNYPEMTVDLHDGSEEQVSIVIVHKDRPDLLNLCLQSIALTSNNYKYEVIVSDNASGKESQEYLDDIRDEIKIVRNDKNIFFGPAATKGAAIADINSKYIIFMHCDVVVLDPRWIDTLINASQANKSGFVGLQKGEYKVQNEPVTYVQDWCVLYTRECWQDIGPFPPTLPQIGAGFYMTMKAQKKGWQPQYVRSSLCHHYQMWSFDATTFEELADKAVLELRRLIRELQVKM